MKARLRTRAAELGFDGCRVTTAAAPGTAARFLEALAEGRHAGMGWLARNAGKRVDPDQVLKGVRSVICLAASYEGGDGGNPGAAAGCGVVARYARYEDYHDVLKPALAELAQCVDAWGGPGTQSLWYVDTGPVLERDLGQRAGLGFIGRHTNLVSRKLGNWFLLSEILTTAVLEPDDPEPNRCGSCTRCLSACPTGAITEPYRLDSNRCLSYWTIEHKGAIPVAMRPQMGARIFGCDDCLAACPWNRFAGEAALLRQRARPELARPRLVDWLELGEAAFSRLFRGTPMERPKRRGLIRNVCVALGNTGDTSVLAALERATNDPEPLVAEHARWAVTRIQERALRQG